MKASMLLCAEPRARGLLQARAPYSRRASAVRTASHRRHRRAPCPERHRGGEPTEPATEEDFEDEAAQQVTATTLDAQLNALEKNLPPTERRRRRLHDASPSPSPFPTHLPSGWLSTHDAR